MPDKKDMTEADIRAMYITPAIVGRSFLSQQLMKVIY